MVVASILACGIFSALCGSSPATAAAIGKVGIPEMRAARRVERAGFRGDRRGRHARHIDSAVDHPDRLRDRDRAIDRAPVPGGRGSRRHDCRDFLGLCGFFRESSAPPRRCGTRSLQPGGKDRHPAPCAAVSVPDPVRPVRALRGHRDTIGNRRHCCFAIGPSGHRHVPAVFLPSVARYRCSGNPGILHDPADRRRRRVFSPTPCQSCM